MLRGNSQPKFVTIEDEVETAAKDSSVEELDAKEAQPGKEDISILYFRLSVMMVT